ncbi:hypothetical protein [Haliea sp. E17]|uniref:hypothetical protein n=1 Tax=Haliea sp. E17 TaxID=3401576 RepID=UPI003AB0D14D
MSNLLLVLLFIFAGVALLAWALERFGPDPDPERTRRLTRWIYPLAGLALVLSALRYFWQ